MGMIEILRLLKGFLDFAAVYCFHKCIRTMLAGMGMLLLICIIRKCNRRHAACVNIGAMVLLLPMAFMGMNKLFFKGYIYWYLNSLYHYTRDPIFGRIYFGVMGILLLIHIIKSRHLKRKLRNIPVFEDEIREEIIERLTACDRTALPGRYLRRTRIYITPEKISPYSGGIIHPFIVIPEELTKNWDKTQQRVILSHEFLHIRSGHIVLLFLFAMLRIYWWLNPAVYLCEKVLREDLEMACDESCIWATGVSRVEYGRLILGMITMLKSVQEECAASFLDGNYFEVLRRRIGYLNERKAAGNRGDIRKRTVSCFGILTAALLLVIAFTSYPRYTKMKEISFYNEDLEMVVWDSREFGDSVKIVDGEVRIDKEEFRKILEKEDIRGEYVYISFDLIMKVPGAGGGGNVAMVNMDDYDDIWYLAADDWSNKLAVFLMKYLI